MEALLLIVAAYLSVALAKAVLMLYELPAAVAAVTRVTGRPVMTTALMLIVGVVLQCVVSWPAVLMSEGWRFFMAYSRFSVIRDILMIYGKHPTSDDSTCGTLVQRLPEMVVRPHDLIAKTAGVTLKDTIRVMHSMRVVAEHFECSLDELIELPVDLERPKSEQADACSREYEAMSVGLDRSGRCGEISRIRQIGLK